MNQKNSERFDVTAYMNDSATSAYSVVETDGGEPVEENEDEDDRDLPTEFGLTGQDAGRPVDFLDYAKAGDRVLWGDRKQPLTVARVVEPNDPIGQSLTAGVISGTPPSANPDDPAYSEPEFGRNYQNGDVLLNPDAWGTLTGKKFVVIQGPRGGFYALTRDESNSHNLVLFRAVRTYHKTKAGQKGQGAFRYDRNFDDEITVVEAGDEPDELDPEGDLPTYDEIKDSPLMGWDSDLSEAYEVGTVEEAFEEGLSSALNRAAREFETLKGDDEEDEEGPYAEVPAPEEVARTPDGYSHSSVVVEAVEESEYGLKAVLDGPAPWDTPDDETPMNEVLKGTPWEETHYDFDADRKKWTVDANELIGVASEFAYEGYSVRADYELPN